MIVVYVFPLHTTHYKPLQKGETIHVFFLPVLETLYYVIFPRDEESGADKLLGWKGTADRRTIECGSRGGNNNPLPPPISTIFSNKVFPFSGRQYAPGAFFQIKYLLTSISHDHSPRILNKKRQMCWQKEFNLAPVEWNPRIQDIPIYNRPQSCLSRPIKNSVDKVEILNINNYWYR